MAKLPALSDTTERKLALKWSILIDEYRLTGVRRDERTVDHIEKKNSLLVAQERMWHLVDEYFRLWVASGKNSNIFRGWLPEIKQRVSREIASVFAEHPALDLWYEKACKWDVEKVLAAAMKRAANRARNREIIHIEAVSQGLVENAGPSLADFALTDVSPGSRSERPQPRMQQSLESRSQPQKHLDERKKLYNDLKGQYRKAGKKMSEEILGSLACYTWRSRDPVAKWKQGTDRDGHDGKIRLAIEKAKQDL